MKRVKTKRIIIISAAAAATVLLAFAAIKLLEIKRPEYLFYIEEWWYDMTTSDELRERSITELSGKWYASAEEAQADTELAGKLTFNDSLMLVNSRYKLPEGFEPELEEYRDSGVIMNACITEPYALLTGAVTDAVAEKLYISSSYRTAEKQAQVYNEDKSVAALPGESEHQTGLALDVYVQYYGGYSFVKTPAGQFIAQNSWKYGFIVRYPKDKTKITGIPYEPWHIRYVGQPHAEIMRKNSLAFEEYTESLKPGAVYEYGRYFIIRCEADALFIPTEIESAVISSDNTGKYIVTAKRSEAVQQ